MVQEMSMEMIIVLIILSTSDESASDPLMANLFQALGDGIPLRAEKAGAYSISSKELV